MRSVKIFVLFFILIAAMLSTTPAQSSTEEIKIKAFNQSIEAEETEDYSKALEYIKVIYDDFKDDYLVNLRLGWLYYLNEKYNESEKYYKEAMRISDRSIESLLGLTYPLFAKGKMDELIEVYKTILKVNPNNFQANYQLGLIYLNKKDYLNAKALFQKIHNNFPSNYAGNLYLGWTYYYLGSNEKANKLFTDALIAKPDDKSALEGFNLTK